VKALRKLAGIPGYGLLYCSVLNLVAIPSALIYLALFGYGPKGLLVRITPPTARAAQHQQDCLVISVIRRRTDTTTDEPELRLNSTPVSWAYLRRNLEVELSLQPGRTVFVEGDGSLEFADVVRVIDIARGVRPEVPVVLLTPLLKKTLGNACVKHEP
jgi:Biopolymer transport protein ExbD/TolR